MKSVMVDNMFMEEVVHTITEPYISKAYSDFLMSLILWDEIYYPENINNWWNSIQTPVKDLLKPIKDDRISGDNLTGVPDLLNLHHGRPDVLVCGAVYYMELCSRNNCDYLPSTARQKMLLDPSNDREIRSILPVFQKAYRTLEWSRYRFNQMNQLDTQIAEHYHEVFKEMFGNNLGCYDIERYPKLYIPVLTDHILSNTPAGMNPVEYALHLRYEGSVVRYREYLNEVETSFNDKNESYSKIAKKLEASRDYVSDVLSENRKIMSECMFRILPMPSLLLRLRVSDWNLEINVPSTSPISVEKSIQKYPNDFQLTFLRDITETRMRDIESFFRH